MLRSGTPEALTIPKSDLKKGCGSPRDMMQPTLPILGVATYPLPQISATSATTVTFLIIKTILWRMWQMWRLD